MSPTVPAEILKCIDDVLWYLESEGLQEPRVRAFTKEELLHNVRAKLPTHADPARPIDLAALKEDLRQAWTLLHPKPTPPWVVETQQKIYNQLREKQPIQPKPSMHMNLPALLTLEDTEKLKAKLAAKDRGDLNVRACTIGSILTAALSHPDFQHHFEVDTNP